MSKRNWISEANLRQTCGLFFGDWVYDHHITQSGERPRPFAFQSFFAEGSAPSKVVDSTFKSVKDRWKLTKMEVSAFGLL